MEQLIKTIVLGIIQGLTEWLPISSTGHLKLAEYFLDLKVPILFDVILHLGTLIVVFFFFRKEVKKILSALIHLDFKTEYGKFVPLIIVGTTPAAVIGLAFGDQIEAAFQSPVPIASMFVICGILVYSAKTGIERTGNISYSVALIIGIAQGIAIIPGISRSGVTIAIALLLGIKREKAFKFSFLLSIPAIVGAFGLTLHKQFNELAASGLGWSEIIIGMLIAMVVGYFALKLLWKTLDKKKFHLFAFYLWLIGMAIIVLSLGLF